MKWLGIVVMFFTFGLVSTANLMAAPPVSGLRGATFIVG